MTDYISRADAICEVLVNDGIDNIVKRINALPSAEAETVDCTDFIRWLTETVMDDGMWELNAVAYGEVIARKLTKLGVLEVKDDVYIYEPSAEAEQGEWIHDGQNFKGGLDWCHCSECGYKTSTNGLSVYRYCPSCGARMKGGAEE